MQALVEASKGDGRDRDIYTSCCGILLFGVPNRGLQINHIMSMVKGQPNEQLVTDLGPQSELLPELQREFTRSFANSEARIISIYETMDSPTVEVYLSYSSRSL